MLASRHDILNYIPQRSPMVMIDDLMEASDESAVTQFVISPENIFVDNGFFSEPGLVENIAQTAAAQVGYQCQKKNVPVPVGYIAAVKDLKIISLPSVGSEISTSIRIVNHVMDVTLARGEVKIGDEVCCSCEMRIFVKA